MNICLYMRMSTSMQENSIESQRQVLHTYAERNGMKIIQEYADEGISGRTASKRPAFLQMIEDSEKRRFSAVLIYDSSRFARNLEESIVYKSLLKRSGVKLISATEPTQDDDTSLITDALLGAMNEMYSRKLGKSVRRGMDFKARQGFSAGLLPFGYTKDGGGVPVIVENEAEIIRCAFELFTTTHPTYSGVAKALNAYGARQRGGREWEARDVKRLLQRKVYAGFIERQFDSPIPYEGKHRAIIDMNTYIKSRNLAERLSLSRRRGANAYAHWLSGIFRCHACGSVMTYSRHAKHGYFRCRQNAAGVCKASKQINIKKAENIVFDILKDILSGAKAADYSNITPPSFLGGKKSVVKQLQRLNRQLERCSEAFSEGIDTLEEYREKKAAVTKKINELKNMLDGFEIVNMTGEACELLGCLENPGAAPEEKNTAIRQIIHKIVVNHITGEAIVFLNY